MQDLYAYIRPYEDREVASVVRRLLKSVDLQKAIIRYRFSHWPQSLQAILAPLARLAIRYRLRNVNNIEDFQRWMLDFVDVLLHKAMNHIEIRGLNNLDPESAYLGLSSHRVLLWIPP